MRERDEYNETIVNEECDEECKEKEEESEKRPLVLKVTVKGCDGNKI